MIKAKLRDALKEAMRAKDRVRLGTLRLAISAIQYEEVQKGVDELPDDAVIALLQLEAKKRRESIEFEEKAGRADQKAQLLLELKVLADFLPQQLSEADLTRIISDLKTADPAINIGAVMKALRERYAGQFDGKLASEAARRVLGA